MPTLSILVTGATDGIGLRTAMELAKRGHFVILHGRSEEKLVAVARQIKTSFPTAALDTIRADFSELSQVKAMATEVAQRFPKLNVLVNNAGVFSQSFERTKEGFEIMFGVNYLAHFALTLLLLPVLKANQPSRIVHVSSVSHEHEDSLSWENLNCEKSKFVPYRQYCISKLGNVMFSNELARRMKQAGGYEGVTSNSLHPGVIDTKLLFTAWNGGLPGAPVTEGIKTSVFLVSSPIVDGVSGQYFTTDSNGAASQRMNPFAMDAKACADFWEVSKAMAGVSEPAF